MSFFRRALPVGAVLLGTTFGGVSAYFGSNIVRSPVAAGGGNNPPGASGAQETMIPVLPRDDLELKFVQIFFRHGARTPLNSIPNVEEAYWDKSTIFGGASDLCIDYNVCDLEGGEQPVWHTENHYRRRTLRGGSYGGQLTAKGMKQAHQLGTSLRKHYIDNLHFLPAEFSPELVYTRSTNIHRTLQSLGCLLGGLYGQDMASQKGPVTLYVAESSREILYPNSGNCKQLSQHYSSIFKDMFSVPGIRHAAAVIAPLLNYSEGETKKLDFIRVRDDLTARIEHDVDVPTYLLPVLDLIDRSAVVLCRYLIEGSNALSKDIIRISAGPTMHYLTQTLDAVCKKEISYKLHLNSCHDTTLMTILLALDAYDDVWPPLTAAVIFELYQDKKGKSYVRAVYQGKELKMLKSGKTLLPLEKFKELIAPVSYTNEDYVDACKLSH
ncbi:lysophosphatidic acid phosphatase type 6-like [Diadema antillarum]|uniref:lysophosphatidic acid phosphatase type 6-like n=1 Tax=Diadema antillarum TaxID=105358 RepID=UPI003A835D3C